MARGVKTSWACCPICLLVCRAMTRHSIAHRDTKHFTMTQPAPLRIDAVAGYSPMIGRLVGMLTYARSTTLAAVAGLTTTQLDHLHDAASNSIGALLAHMAAVERSYQIMTFENR